MFYQKLVKDLEAKGFHGRRVRPRRSLYGLQHFKPRVLPFHYELRDHRAQQSMPYFVQVPTSLPKGEPAAHFDALPHDDLEHALHKDPEARGVRRNSLRGLAVIIGYGNGVRVEQLVVVCGRV